MSEIDEMYKKYSWADPGKITPDENEELGEKLKDFETGKIRSCADAEKFIELVACYRKYATRMYRFIGKGAQEIIQENLEVGTNGVYSDPYRYIYELIQNADDCRYSFPGDRGMDIFFDFEKNTIRLKYNEDGFTPHNVFAITGIAEESKGLSDEVEEIGEKGIGFKSVFGIAGRVTIQSGLFSFMLKDDNTIVPIPLYEDGFSHMDGTEMTLYMSGGPGAAERAYDDLVKRYSSDDAIFNRNPVLFLNKLTQMSISGRGQTLTFSVRKPKPEEIVERGGFVENGVSLSVAYAGDGEKDFKREMTCHILAKKITYTRKDYESRYGKDTKLAESGSNDKFVYAVVPDVGHVSELRRGTLYSYLPTNVHFNMPMAMHVPFKLSPSREYVDPQDRGGTEVNSWYDKSMKAMEMIFDETYRRLSDVVREDIMFYIPRDESVFDVSDSTTYNLFGKTYVYDRNDIFRLEIFCTDDGKKKKGDVVCVVRSKDDNDIDLTRAYEILKPEGKSLFRHPDGIDPAEFGIEVISDLKENVFRRAFEDPALTEAALACLEGLSLSKLHMDVRGTLTMEQIVDLAADGEICSGLASMACNKIKRVRIEGVDALPNFRADLSVGVEDLRNLIPDFDKDEIGSKTVLKYLELIGYSCITVDVGRPVHIPMHDALVLSRGPSGDVSESFGDFCYHVDNLSNFGINRKIDEMVNEINDAVRDGSISDQEYLQKLRSRQITVRKTLGDFYKNYCDCIINSGKDPRRFIGELLQNADDCAYPEGAVPEFSLTLGDGKITTVSNESGFTRENVKAITEIADSTKTRLLNREEDPIGEKGVGFKTVFSTAESVKIVSGAFSFGLTRDEPTVPVLGKTPAEPFEGTKMVFEPKNPFPADYLTESEVLKLVLCLHNLKRVTLGGYRTEIVDGDGVRVIRINGEREYRFKRVDSTFDVTDPSALAERRGGRPNVNTRQHIHCYYTTASDGENKENRRPDTGYPGHVLYCGLPTDVRISLTSNFFYYERPGTPSQEVLRALFLSVRGFRSDPSAFPE